MNNIKERNQYIDLVKFFACIFITNSHCMYSNPLLKLGGGWGNAIFFAVSGFLLGDISSDFSLWIVKRLKRVAPLTIIMTIISVFIYGIDKYNLWQHVTRFWFVLALIIYFIPFYFADRFKHGYLTIIVSHILGYIIFYNFSDKSTFFVELGGFSLFKVYFYIFVMFCGGIVKKRNESNLKNDIKPSIFVILGVLGLAIWFMEYYEVKVLGNWLSCQFLIHVGASIFGLSVLLWALYMYKSNIPFKLPNIVKGVADSTLEIYLIQITFLPLVNQICYPLCIIVFWVVALLGGLLLHKLVVICSTER